MLTVIAGTAAVVVAAAIIGIVLTTRTEDVAGTTPAATAPAAGADSPAPVPTSDTTPAQGPSTPGTGAGPDDALRSMLNTVTMTGCEAPASSDSNFADATLRCIGAEGIEVLAYHFPDRSALDRQIGARATYYADTGNCDDGRESVEEWQTSQEPNGGARLCYRYADRFVTFWSIDDSLVAFAASDRDAARLVAWWHRFDPMRR